MERDLSRSFLKSIRNCLKGLWILSFALLKKKLAYTNSTRLADVISSKPISENVMEIFANCNFKKLTLKPEIPHKADLLARFV